MREHTGMGIESSSEAKLARRCRGGDPDAWREFVRRFTPLVHRLALRMLRDGAEAEDVCQEVFLKMHRAFDSYDATRPLAPWVSRIAYNACLRRLQAAGRRPTPGADTGAGPEGAEPVARAPDPEQSAAAGQAAALLLEALEALTAQDRGLLALRYREGLSDSEVAEATGMPVNTVKTRIFRARAKLRTLLGPRLGTEDA